MTDGYENASKEFSKSKVKALVEATTKQYDWNYVFIGANTNLIAPIKVGDDSFIAAGGTITNDVPENSFVIGRSRQTVKKQ